jgi:CubicO group peptidase (beta-lactamase class C family)
VDKGVLDWETPILQLLPSFRLGDGELAKKLTLRHTVSASTGLPSHGGDFAAVFHLQDSSPEIELARIATMKPTTALGEVFQYSNVMVAAGGLIAAHAAYPKLPLGEAYE